MSRLPDEVRELLERPNLAHVATVMADGMPHVVPTWVGLEDEQIVFLTGLGRKRPAISQMIPVCRCRSLTTSTRAGWPMCVGV